MGVDAELVQCPEGFLIVCELADRVFAHGANDLHDGGDEDAVGGGR